MRSKRVVSIEDILVACYPNKKAFPKTVQERKKSKSAKYKDLPTGISEQRGCRYEYFTKKGNPIGQIKYQLSTGKWFSRTYGDTRTRSEAIELVKQAKLEDKLKEGK